MLATRAIVRGPAGSVRVWLAIDTGAVFTVMPAGLLAAVGYRFEDAASRQQIITASGIAVAHRHIVAQVSDLGVERERLAMLAHDLPASAPINGLLGLDFFRGRRLTIDFRAGAVELD